MTNADLNLLRPTSIVVDAPPGSLAGDDRPQTSKPTRKMPALRMPAIKLDRSRRSSAGTTLVGLDIQPGYATAVQAKVNGAILVHRAAGTALPPDTVREGEVLDSAALAQALREMFRESRLDRRVRIGIANQRTVLRRLELPPLSDGKELAAAVRFQAEEQVPMPLENAVLDHHALGVVDTPAGPRQRVILVAAQRDMVERLLSAVREAGLRPEAVDLSAFALIRSLHRADEQHTGRVLYLNVGGLTNMAIAEGGACYFTRVVSGGLESMASEVAERHGVSLVNARELLTAVDLRDDDVPVHEPEHSSTDARPVLLAGVRDIAGEVRNSLDFHRSQEGGAEVTSVILSGAALAIEGFADALQGELAVPVISQTVGLTGEGSAGGVSPERLAVAAGLAAEVAPR